MAWEPSVSKECGLGRPMRAQELRHGCLRHPCPIQATDPWLLPSRTKQKYSKAGSDLHWQACGHDWWLDAGKWAERPEHEAVTLPLLSFSKQKCKCRNPLSSSCQERLPFPQASGRVAVAFRFSAPTSSALSAAPAAGWRLDVLPEPGMMEGGGAAP